MQIVYFILLYVFLYERIPKYWKPSSESNEKYKTENKHLWLDRNLPDTEQYYFIDSYFRFVCSSGFCYDNMGTLRHWAEVTPHKTNEK